MKVWEALEILQGLSPNMDCTLQLGTVPKKTTELPKIDSISRPGDGAGDFITRQWVIGKEDWVNWNRPTSISLLGNYHNPDDSWTSTRH